jgi:hypothetical protein
MFFITKSKVGYNELVVKKVRAVFIINLLGDKERNSIKMSESNQILV